MVRGLYSVSSTLCADFTKMASRPLRLSPLGAAILVKARQRVARGMTGLLGPHGWRRPTATKDGKAARAKALRAAVSVLSGAGVAGPKE